MIYTIEQLRDIVKPIAASYGIKSMYLFGSYARGEATGDSDVDLLIDRAGMEAGWTIGGLYADLAEALGKELDLVTTTGADTEFIKRIQTDAVSLYEQSLEEVG